jgi:hypothetical protein
MYSDPATSLPGLNTENYKKLNFSSLTSSQLLQRLEQSLVVLLNIGSQYVTTASMYLLVIVFDSYSTCFSEYEYSAFLDVRGLYPSSGKGVWGLGVFNQSINQSTLSNFDARYARVAEESS